MTNSPQWIWQQPEWPRFTFDMKVVEDGNGRVGRAIIDLALAQDANMDQRLHSVSRRLAENRNDYYAELAAASRGSLDITRWLTWFVGQFEDACRAEAAKLDAVITANLRILGYGG